jgi:low affinity Fe/Cu permease
VSKFELVGTNDRCPLCTSFLMVFLIQNTQNRETLALQIKLSELILAMDGARNKIAYAELADEEALEKIKTQIHHKASGEVSPF